MLSARSDQHGLWLPHALPRALAADPEPAAAFATFDPNVVIAPIGSARRAALESRAAGALDRAYAYAQAGIAVAEVAQGDKSDEAQLLRFMAAQIAREQGLIPEAVALLEPVAESEHPLALWARLNVAEWLEGSDPARGLALIEPLLQEASQGFPGTEAARRARGRLLAQLGRVDEAIEQLESALAAISDQAAAAPVALPLADLLAAQPQEESRLRAVALYRRVAYRLPGTKLSRTAEQSAALLLASLSPRARASARKPSAEDELARADALLAESRFAEAERAYAAVQAEPKLQASVLCRARYGRAKLLLNRRERIEGAPRMAEVAAQCDQDPDLRAWARYHAGRAYSAIAQNAQAVEQYDALQREAPEHRLADDALFRSSKVLRDMGNSAEARARLEALPLRYPHGDMRPRARFVLAWQTYAEGDVAGAAEMLAEASIEPEDAEDLHGRAPYWRARFLAESGREAESQAAFAALFIQTPLSYYGQQAFARLEALAPARARELVQNLAVASQHSDLVFAADAALSRPGFARAVALLQVGDTSLAMSELRELGFISPTADAELHWLSVALFDRAGAHTLSVELARKRVFDLLQRPPMGRDLAFYRLAYPPAFAPLIEETCHRENVPSAFVRAVAREESAFNPRAVSRAQAYGLVQIIEPTARLIAQSLDLPHDIEALRRPEINLALGTRFINTLTTGLGGQLALVPAAYNAGPGATQRWLTERASEPLDVWIENVPYDETRHYTRRVLQSYGIYAWLDSGRLLSLPAGL